MNQKKNPAVISAKTDKSDVVREIAKRLHFKYREEGIENGRVVRFHFKLNAADTIKLIQSVPNEVYAFSGVFAGLSGDEDDVRNEIPN